MSERRYVRAFVALSALQMLPLGLLVPVEILIMQARGLSATEIGVVVAAVGIGTAVLELPTGGLADVVGRRTVLLAGAVVTLLTLVLFATATEFWVFVAAGLLFSVGKALQSGPLESWFVDAVNDLHSDDLHSDDLHADDLHADDLHSGSPHADERRDVVLTRGLGRAGAATGLALAVGAVAGGLLAELARRGGVPADGTATVLALSVPLLLAAGLVVADVVALLLLMDPHPHPRQGLRGVLGSVGPAITDAGRLVVADPVLRWFGLRWLLIPAGFLAFELVTPLRLTELLADPATAAAVLGPLLAACYVASAATGPLAPWIRRRVGPLLGAGLATAGAGLGFALAGLGGGLVVLVGALLLAQLAIGPVNALNGPYLHARVPSGRRATLLSFESLVAHVSVAVAAVGLGVVVEGGGTGAAFAVAGLLTALAALPLLGVARALRREGRMQVSARPTRSQDAPSSADSPG